MAGVTAPWLAPLAAAYGWAWELRRDAYASGRCTQLRVPARVVSIGNLTVGGAGKTTLALSLAATARARGVEAAVVCRRYRPGPGGKGDEELMYRAALGEGCTFAGSSKRDLARAAAAGGARLVLVDDGFSHWPLARDVDVVMLDATDLWGGEALLPAGRMREPRRALQRAHALVISRLAPGESPARWFEEVRPYAPGALLAAGRHRVTGVRDAAGQAARPGGPARVVTATGNPAAVARSAAEAGYGPVELAAYRDHHWFSVAEADREARSAGAGTLLVTAKDAVRWPRLAARQPHVLEVDWEWVAGGDALERLVAGGGA
jgi:tetraacyldisaccharide 4'-kinase